MFEIHITFSLQYLKVQPACGPEIDSDQYIGYLKFQLDPMEGLVSGPNGPGLASDHSLILLVGMMALCWVVTNTRLLKLPQDPLGGPSDQIDPASDHS